MKKIIVAKSALVVVLSSGLIGCTTVKINAHNRTDQNLDVVVYKAGEEGKPPIQTKKVNKNSNVVDIDMGSYFWGTNIYAVLALPGGGFKDQQNSVVRSSPNPTVLELSADQKDWPSPLALTNPDTILTRLYDANGEPSPDPDAENFVKQWLGGIYEATKDNKYLVKFYAKDVRDALGLLEPDCGVFGSAAGYVKKEIITDSSTKGDVKANLPLAVQSEFSASLNSNQTYKYDLFFQNVKSLLAPISPAILLDNLDKTEKGRLIADRVKQMIASGRKMVLLSSATLVKPKGGKCDGNGVISVQSYKAKSIGFATSLKAADYATIDAGFKWESADSKKFDAVGVVLDTTYVPIEVFSPKLPNLATDEVAEKLQEGTIKPANTELKPADNSIKVEGGAIIQPPQ
ncbi:hypothetical protein [Methylomicrobium lacus]|uniref:hypothetical protein n=1 Tax=Methylomicrobium lacus TaxID=136992 RepID=UPI0035A8C31E